jgi:DnaJ-class molecular chaperone
MMRPADDKALACKACGGTGKVKDGKCPACLGTGKKGLQTK